MAEIITELETSIIDSAGQEYYVQVVGEQLADGRWVAWLEFVPLDDRLEVLATREETDQPTRADILGWSLTLTDIHLGAAFARAAPAEDRGTLARTYPATFIDAVAPFDPFEVAALGKDVLRVRLRPLSRAELLAMINTYGLNPAGKSLARLSDSQLITFVVTAVEVQIRQGRR
jgi:hypothetical protein